MKICQICGKEIEFRNCIQQKHKFAEIYYNKVCEANAMGYITDVTDNQWDIIEPIFKSSKGRNFVKHSKRDLVNAVLYLIKTGCQWRFLPNDFPSYTAVWSFYRRAAESGKWEEAMDLLVKKHGKTLAENLRQPMELLTRKA